MIKQCRLIKYLGCQEPNEAIALEEAIARAVECGSVSNTFRIWRDKNAVVIGRYQCPKMELNIDSCLKHGTTVTRRFTGGGAVYHDCGKLNFTISINREFVK